MVAAFFIVVAFVAFFRGVGRRSPRPKPAEAYAQRREDIRRLIASVDASRAEWAAKRKASAPAAAAVGFGAPLGGRRAIVFVDVETTGFGYADRIVSFGAIKLMIEQPAELRLLHLVFNPERRCHPGATAKHGWDNKTLKRQDVIGPYAASLRAWFEGVDLVVAHNAAFDTRFLNAMFETNGARRLDAQVECTMLAYRARGEGSAALDAISARMGLAPRGRHGALQDAWLCMQAFCWMRELPWKLDFTLAGDAGPANYRDEPPKRPRGRPRKVAAEPA